MAPEIQVRVYLFNDSKLERSQFSKLAKEFENWEFDRLEPPVQVCKNYCLNGTMTLEFCYGGLSYKDYIEKNILPAVESWSSKTGGKFFVMYSDEYTNTKNFIEEPKSSKVVKWIREDFETKYPDTKRDQTEDKARQDKIELANNIARMFGMF